jgi:hypothetical protein
MKKFLVLPLTAILLFGMAGCAANKQVTPISTGTSENQAIAVDSQSEATTAPSDAGESSSEAATSEQPSEKPSESDAGEKTTEDDNLAIPGIWQAASITTKDDNTMEPAYYVQFTKTEICYGHMKDGQFVKDSSDKIVRFSKTVDGSYLVQAESAKAGKYTFKTSESDQTIMEYYNTWEDAEFADKYIGGSSISKCSA